MSPSLGGSKLPHPLIAWDDTIEKRWADVPAFFAMEKCISYCFGSKYCYSMYIEGMIILFFYLPNKQKNEEILASPTLGNAPK